MSEDDSEKVPLRSLGIEISNVGEIFEKTKYKTAIAVLLSHAFTLDDIPPVIYLKAVGELFGITLGFSWVITLIFSREIIEDNPIKTRMGYNNVCVGWDMAPALYFANFMWPLVVYAGCRFCYMNFVRLHLENEQKIIDSSVYKFQWVATLGFLISIFGFSLCLIIPPWENIWGHTVPFLFYIVTRYLVVLAICLNYWRDVTPAGKVFLAYYGFVSFFLPGIALGEYTYYSIYEEKSPWPWYVSMFVDYTWFFCTIVTGKFVPSSVTVTRHYELSRRPTDKPVKQG